MAEQRPEEEQDDGYLPLWKGRSKTLRAVTEPVHTGYGTLFVTLNFNNEGKPSQIFLGMRKVGGSEPAHLEGLSRMIDLCLQSGIDPDAIIDQLSGITSEPIWDNGILIRSAEDGVAHVLKLYRNGIEAAEAQYNRQLVLLPGGEIEARPVDSRSASCPKCKGSVVHQEGCIRCLECGHTKCDDDEEAL